MKTNGINKWYIEKCLEFLQISIDNGNFPVCSVKRLTEYFYVEKL